MSRVPPYYGLNRRGYNRQPKPSTVFSLRKPEVAPEPTQVPVNDVVVIFPIIENRVDKPRADEIALLAAEPIPVSEPVVEAPVPEPVQAETDIESMRMANVIADVVVNETAADEIEKQEDEIILAEISAIDGIIARIDGGLKLSDMDQETKAAFINLIEMEETTKSMLLSIGEKLGVSLNKKKMNKQQMIDMFLKGMGA